MLSNCKVLLSQGHMYCIFMKLIYVGIQICLETVIYYIVFFNWTVSRLYNWIIIWLHNCLIIFIVLWEILNTLRLQSLLRIAFLPCMNLIFQMDSLIMKIFFACLFYFKQNILFLTIYRLFFYL